MESKPFITGKDIGADKNPSLLEVVSWYNTMVRAYDLNIIKSTKVEGFIEWLERLLEMKVALVNRGYDSRMILGCIMVIDNKSIDKV